MSQELINKHFNEVVTSELKKELRKHKGNVIFLNDVSAFNQAIKNVLGSRFRLSKNTQLEALEVGRKKALELQNKFYTRYSIRFANIKTKLIQDNMAKKDEIGKTAFIVSNYRSSLDAIKNEIIKLITSKRSDITKEELSSEVEKSRKTSTTEYEIAENLKELQDITGLSESDIGNLFNNAMVEGVFNLTADEEELLSTLTTNYKSMVGEKVREKYISSFEFKSSSITKGQKAAFEKKVKRVFNKKVLPYLKKNASKLNNLDNRVFNEVLIDNFINKLPKYKNIKSNIEKEIKKANKKVSKGTVVSKFQGKGKKKKIPHKKKVKRPSKEQRERLSIRKLISKINMSLHDIIKKSMGSPRLNYRTGRFAGSAKVLRGKYGPKGTINLDYTYMLDPYQVFEYPHGSPRLATPQRDPRLVIRESIRELAKKQVEARFKIKRVE